MFPNIYYVEIETKIFPNLDYMHFILKSFYNPTDHSEMSEPWKLMQSVQNNSEEERGGGYFQIFPNLYSKVWLNFSAIINANCMHWMNLLE